ncbi:MAG: sarcosine oxidase subunit delta [Proteobacteria bacterium]|nr:sarcosine oxidase subunit delta [Pseudomonadota bacterium]
MLLECPCCGARDLREFVYMGDAGRAVPQLSDGAETWAAYVYERRNPRGLHLEHWQHVHGCRQLLRVIRDTQTHVIDQVALIGPYAAEAGQ